MKTVLVNTLKTSWQSQCGAEARMMTFANETKSQPRHQTCYLKSSFIKMVRKEKKRIQIKMVRKEKKRIQIIESA